jgi:hypothetical protein
MPKFPPNRHRQLAAARSAVCRTGLPTNSPIDETKDTGVTTTVLATDPEILAEHRARFCELVASPYFEQVVAANRLYLTAAIGDPLGIEQSYWAMSCMPKTNASTRFSTLSMSTMEIFVLHKPSTTSEAPSGFVIVSRKKLEDAGDIFDASDLHISASDYVAGGDDQLCVQGSWPALAHALGGTLGRPAPLRDAARALAERLLRGSGTSYGRYHNPYLAAHVLGRTASPHV